MSFTATNQATRRETVPKKWRNATARERPTKEVATPTPTSRFFRPVCWVMLVKHCPAKTTSRCKYEKGFNMKCWFIFWYSMVQQSSQIKWIQLWDFQPRCLSCICDADTARNRTEWDFRDWLKTIHLYAHQSGRWSNDSSLSLDACFHLGWTHIFEPPCNPQHFL